MLFSSRRCFESLCCAAAFALWLGLGALDAVADEARPPVDFTRDVRPILAANCLHCHGQDPSHREADLRLDVFEAAGSDGVSGAESVIVRGTPEESELIARITSDDESMVMPPVDSGKKLKTEEIEILRRWVEQGAEFKPHWAFVAPVKPAAPATSDAAWVKNPIDAFVLDRLDRENLKPSPAASPQTLLRRLSLDLTGLPPTLEELAAFEAELATAEALAGKSSADAATANVASAYARQVDRLLASPAYGERWARLWLDAARYADSDGFEKDKPRFVWMYRDWVIDAFNADMPYDQFVVEQVAGDLLPNATQDQRVATGYLRNSMINEEGGIDPEQFRMEAMYDRIDAIGKGVLGLTVQCAQCHTHKYDPITHTDYYRLFAFLNNCDEAQTSAYTDGELAEWAATRELIDRLENQLKAATPDWEEKLAAWEAGVTDDSSQWSVVRPELDASGGQKHYLLEDGSVLAAGYAPTKHATEFTVTLDADAKVSAVRLELLNDPNLPHGGPGRSIDGMFGLTEMRVAANFAAEPNKRVEQKIVSATADADPPGRPLDVAFDDQSKQRRLTGPIEYAIDGDNLTAWSGDIGPGRSNVPHQAVFVLEKPIDAKAGTKLTFTLVQQHGGWNSDANQNNNLGRFRFAVTGADGAKADAIPAAVRKILAIPLAERSAHQEAELFSYWRTTVADFAETNRRLDALWQSHPRGTTQLVLAEREQLRPTHRLERGNFLQPAEAVTPGVPSFLHPLAAERPTRLDFARWLVDPKSPTAARAAVNRIWQAYFGSGLVTTAEDLGTQGDLPTHPELLDWLACELMEHGWSQKHVHQLIVSSATYQQAAAASPELLARDPANQLLARGPRYRVDAETVRDVSLAVSGLLTQKIGGPSVYPPAPEFLFQPPTSYGPKIWDYDAGADKYRRALYTFRYRSVPYPAFESFDAPRGDVACVRRPRSNTPLQALTTLNESLYLECARELARRIVVEGGQGDEERIRYAVRRCLSRSPAPAELATLAKFLGEQKLRFQADGADPGQLLSDDDSKKLKPLPGDAAPADLAAWTALARVVLNLDETITKE
ncbi:PSD1 and planctomycete cytochrome C domain-containing protein [Lacipirellula sp.]|uniref:PSD1 and planctomycete cytochrome C domain-containing protein n=1 Tax=Lacipirellula sp. TaxID=2691419 RepID=UPI003D0FD274